MPMNRVQFQPGLSLPEFLKQFGTESQCAAELEQSRWPQGFVCPCCAQTSHRVFKRGQHKTFQCKSCRHQTSLTAGTLFQSTQLPLAVWFLAIYLVSQAKTGLSSLALKRLLGVSYPTAWLLQHKLMATMSERDAAYPLSGRVDIDDAYLGGELSGGKVGWGGDRETRCLLSPPCRSTTRDTLCMSRCPPFRPSPAKPSPTGQKPTWRPVAPSFLTGWPALLP